MIKLLHLLLGHPGDLLSAGILSFDILSDLSASILVTCWSHSVLLLCTHTLIGWILQDYQISWLLILSIFVLPTIFLSTFISLALNICLGFDILIIMNILNVPINYYKYYDQFNEIIYPMYFTWTIPLNKSTLIQ